MPAVNHSKSVCIVESWTHELPEKLEEGDVGAFHPSMKAMTHFCLIDQTESDLDLLDALLKPD